MPDSLEGQALSGAVRDVLEKGRVGDGVYRFGSFVL